MQIEALDIFIGLPPIEEFEWPRDDPAGTFTAKLRKETTQEWSSTGITIKSGYDWNLRRSGGYEFTVAFTPTLALESKEPLSPEQWLDEWVLPLKRLVSFSTRQTRRICWVNYTVDGGDGKRATAQMFGSGITQMPYTAVAPPLSKNDSAVLSISSLPCDLPDFVQRWRTLDESANPFPELYRLATVQDLPARAHFLYLIQALEGLHEYEHRATQEQQDSYRDQRKAACISSMGSRVFIG